MVLPEEIEQLRAVLSIAAENNVSLWALPNAAGNGGMVNSPPDKDVLLIDQSRMNRIVEVNAKGAYALVEPGVSYEQLARRLQENKTGLWVDCDRNGLNSVAGSVTAREFGYTAYGDHMMMQCGMEGDVGRRQPGQVGHGRPCPGATPGSWQNMPMAPYLDGLFTQSNFGVVTRWACGLMPAPPAYQPFAVALESAGDLARAIEILRSFKVNVIVPNTVVISNPALDASPFAAARGLCRRK